METARTDRAAYYKANNGRPQNVVAPRPLPPEHHAAPVGTAANAGAPRNEYNRPGTQPNAPAGHPEAHPVPAHPPQSQPAPGYRAAPESHPAPVPQSHPAQPSRPEYQSRPEPQTHPEPQSHPAPNTTSRHLNHMRLRRFSLRGPSPRHSGLPNTTSRLLNRILLRLQSTSRRLRIRLSHRILSPSPGLSHMPNRSLTPSISRNPNLRNRTARLRTVTETEAHAAAWAFVFREMRSRDTLAVRRKRDTIGPDLEFPRGARWPTRVHD